MPNREEVERSLNSLRDRKVENRGDSLWVTCPWHSDGQEKTPSLKVNLGTTEYSPGSWVCFGCSPHRHGNWHKLAVKLGLRSKHDDEDDLYVSDIPDAVKSKLLDDCEPLDELHSKLAREPIIQTSQNWRGIKGWLLNEIQARVTNLGSNGVTTEYSRVYLPVHIKGAWQGGIFCSWNEHTKLKYENEKHESNRILFPYDHVVKELKTEERRQVCLVEGPRDALNLIQNGILAVANLGADTVWSEEKAELIAELNLQSLIIATDPDKVGNAIATIVKRSLGNTIPRIARFRMEVKLSETGKVLLKEDPGSLSPDRMRYLKNSMKELD